MSDRPRIDLDILRTITDCLRRANETARRVAAPERPIRSVGAGSLSPIRPVGTASLPPIRPVGAASQPPIRSVAGGEPAAPLARRIRRAR
ncbi:hypothetical protein BJY16_004374 [Actinoplanes octamycinicus]|uniref:Uncharacterized protein n=1 Tax=Actinoplanes octamycinicus TaxID=135948 RepID=A0A7W7GYZ3_9ACTN|nr:hypothetical protein [Actinoplanes octamycinicus]MBB4740915.1 hypothetical protein [Actinoplanes octamycinicus]GIE55822.1 hypothetical protein Aoc01nite_12240 [Actinoplanes octamycinicus]